MITSHSAQVGHAYARFKSAVAMQLWYPMLFHKHSHLLTTKTYLSCDVLSVEVIRDHGRHAVDVKLSDTGRKQHCSRHVCGIGHHVRQCLHLRC